MALAQRRPGKPGGGPPPNHKQPPGSNQQNNQKKPDMSGGNGRFVVNIWDKDKAYNGTTIFMENGRDSNNPRIVEIDMSGKVIWEYELPDEIKDHVAPGFDVEVLENNHVLFVAPTKGVYEIDREGKILWSHQDSKVTHDVDRLPNGNTIYVFGQADKHDDRHVTEVDPEGEVVWSWSAGGPYYRAPWLNIDKQGWAHTNAVTRLPNGNTLVNLRNLFITTEVAPDGTVVWDYDWSRFGKNTDPHEPEILDNGNLLICLQRDASQIAAEIDRDSGELVWSYDSDNLRTARDCDRLPNGNTLIVAVDQGGTENDVNMDDDYSVMLEVTPAGEIVWRLVLEDRTVGKNPGYFYKAQRLE